MRATTSIALIAAAVVAMPTNATAKAIESTVAQLLSDPVQAALAEQQMKER